jgi:hypothetical protein
MMIGTGSLVDVSRDTVGSQLNKFMTYTEEQVEIGISKAQTPREKGAAYSRAGSHAAQLGSLEVARKYWTDAEKIFESMGSEGEPFVSAVRHRLSLLPPVSNDPRPVAEPAQDVGTLEQEAGIVGSLMMYFRNLNLADQAHEPRNKVSGRRLHKSSLCALLIVS